MTDEAIEPRLEALVGADVLVTGATGFTGSVLVRRLAAAGAHVRAIARPGSRVDTFSDVAVEWFRGDVFDAPTVAAASRGVQYVFHLAAAYREARATEATCRRVHVDGTRRLAEAVAGCADFRRFIHVSTIGVHGHIGGPPADESAPFDPGDAYQRTKADAERWIREFASGSGVPLVVVRPCAIYGPGDTRLLKIFRMVARGWFPVLGRTQGLYHLIHVEDLVDMLILAALHQAARAEVFIAGNPDPIPLDRVVRIIAAALGRDVRLIRLPVWPAMAAAVACEAVCRPFGLEPILHRRRVAFYTKDRAFDTRKVRTVLGHRVRFSNEEGLTQTAAWYRSQGWL
jgi:nucleoside-diphosphate-sugar epimerase